jgi:hypothetical protein
MFSVRDLVLQRLLRLARQSLSPVPRSPARWPRRTPADGRTSIWPSLVRSMDDAELRRARRAAAAALAAELAPPGAALAARLHPTLTELAAAG